MRAIALAGLAVLVVAGASHGAPAGDDDEPPARVPSPRPSPPPVPASPAEQEATSDPGEPPTGAGRFGMYHDSDQTTVWRALATLAKNWGDWSVNGSVAVDAVSSASIDVRALG